MTTMIPWEQQHLFWVILSLTEWGFLYDASNVENGATIDDGSRKPQSKQIGSEGDDRIAFSDGVKVDANGISATLNTRIILS